ARWRPACRNRSGIKIMHKTILFLFAFLITPITASYAVVGNTEITVNPDYDGSGSSSIGGTTTNPPIGWICNEEEIMVDGKCTKPDKCSDRSCSILDTQTNKTSDFAKCVWVDKTNNALLVLGIASTYNKCQKKWFCKEAGYYVQIKSKPVKNGELFSRQFFASCEPCPSACRKDDTDCINNTTTQTTTQTTGQTTLTYSTAQSVRECYLKGSPPQNTGNSQTTGTDEIGSFWTKPYDDGFGNPYSCPY
ncbi:MAG: hypothetical protein J6R99_03550, partial [Alphaproteobacteria bacterium]|nr:hypothetical protein [Alphaproteobacteria bacterium]